MRTTHLMAIEPGLEIVAEGLEPQEQAKNIANNRL